MDFYHDCMWAVSVFLPVCNDHPPPARKPSIIRVTFYWITVSVTVVPNRLFSHLLSVLGINYFLPKFSNRYVTWL